MFVGKNWHFLVPDGGDGTGGAGGAVTGTPETAAETAKDTTDYKELYEKLKSNHDKLKRSFDTAASEIAELKKQNKAKMSEEEQRQAEAEEREQQRQAEAEEKEQLLQDALSQLNEIKTSNVFAKQGYDEKDYSELAKKLVETCGENASEVAEIIISFNKKSNTKAIANAKNGMIKDGAVAPKPTGTNEEHTFANIAIEQNRPQSRTEEIKKYYSNK